MNHKLHPSTRVALPHRFDLRNGRYWLALLLAGLTLSYTGWRVTATRAEGRSYSF